MKALGLVLLCSRRYQASAESILGPFPSELNWTNIHGGPLLPQGDPIALLAKPSGKPPSLAPPLSASPSNVRRSSLTTTYAYQPGFLDDGNQLGAVQVESLQAAFDECTAAQLC